MKFFLDANVLIDIANETADAHRLQTRLDAAGPRRCALSAITIEELHYCVLSGPAVKKGYQVRNLKALIAALVRVDFTPDAARAAVALRLQIKDWPNGSADKGSQESPIGIAPRWRPRPFPNPGAHGAHRITGMTWITWSTANFSKSERGCGFSGCV